MADNYPFLSIYEDETGLSEVMEQELDKRYKYALKNPETVKTWVEVKQSSGKMNSFKLIINPFAELDLQVAYKFPEILKKRN